jgi:hypothetical protein
MLERGMLRPLIGRPVIAIIMATVGLASVPRTRPMIWEPPPKMCRFLSPFALCPL